MFVHTLHCSLALTPGSCEGWWMFCSRSLASCVPLNIWICFCSMDDYYLNNNSVMYITKCGCCLASIQVKSKGNPYCRFSWFSEFVETLWTLKIEKNNLTKWIFLRKIGFAISVHCNLIAAKFMVFIWSCYTNKQNK